MSDSSADDAARKERERQRKRAYYVANRERILEESRQRYADDPERFRAEKRASYDADAKREENQRYRKENRDRLQRQARERYAADPEKYREERRKYAANNREAVNKRERDRVRADPELARERNAKSRQWQAANVDHVRKYRRQRNLRWFHGIDEATWAAMLEAQQGKCIYCQQDLDGTAVVEHWHGCGTGHEPKKSCPACRRGLACQICNVIIGFAQDDPERLALMAVNLRTANADVAERQANASMQLQLEFG